MKNNFFQNQQGLTSLKNSPRRIALTGHSTGFTLLELLIAVSIFAASVVLVVGGFGISTKNQRQIRLNRDTSQNIRQISQEISREIEFSLNAPVRNIRNIPITQEGAQVYNFAVVTSPGSDTSTGDLDSGGVLFVRGADNHCRYYRLVEDTNFEPVINRLAVFIDRQEGCGDLGGTPDYGKYFLTDEKTNITSLTFKGVMNQKNKNLADGEKQAYVWLIVNSKTSDGEFNIPLNTRTMATIRNYSREE